MEIEVSNEKPIYTEVPKYGILVEYKIINGADNTQYKIIHEF